MMEYNDCIQQIQKYLENSPLIILGSGSSAAYGLPLMSELSEEIKQHSDKFDTAEFSSLCANLDTMNLEEAIDKTTLTEDSLEVLRKVVWQFINSKDLECFQQLLQDKSDFALAELLQIVIQPTPNTATVVTTNYDRLVEYAADLIGASTVTGFEGSLIRTAMLPNTTAQQRRIRVRERVVNVWKVHGSLDWFSNTAKDIVSFPLSVAIPASHSPQIIAPGKGKYNITHNEPYRDIIAQADSAFTRAGSFLCIGYGFNDDHIQPKLIEQIKNGKPIVALCRTATEACRENVISDNVNKYVVIERSDDSKTSVTGNDYTEVYDGGFWNLPEFIKTVWR